MRRPFSVLLFVCLLSAARADIGAEAPDPLVWTYEYLLATASTERELALIRSRVAEDERLYDDLPERELTDFATEVLLARFNDPDFPTETKILLIKMIDAAKSRRYGPALTRVRNQALDPRVRSWARAASQRLIRDHDSEYVPGTVDFRALVADAENAALNSRPTSAQGEHLARFAGGTITELFAWAGRPHHVSSRQTWFSDGLIYIKIQHITFYYRGLGSVVYGFDRLSHEWKFHAVHADPLAFEGEFPFRQRAAELGLPDAATLEMAQLVSGYPVAMKRAVEINLQRDPPRLEFLDTAAELLATRVAVAKDEQSVDVNGWICRLLARRGGPRYEALLKKIAAGTDDRKIRRLASLERATVAGVETQPYVVGSISLDAQREKYPSPYPESTFQNHRAD